MIGFLRSSSVNPMALSMARAPARFFPWVMVWLWSCIVEATSVPRGPGEPFRGAALRPSRLTENRRAMPAPAGLDRNLHEAFRTGAGSWRGSSRGLAHSGADRFHRHDNEKVDGRADQQERDDGVDEL